jgi:SAM-dependent methyltransferase
MPAHFVILGAVQWALAWLWWYPGIAAAGAAAAFVLLAASTVTAGLGLWGPFVRRGRGKGSALVVHTREADIAPLAAAICQCRLPCAVFLSPRQAADTRAVERLLQAGCEIGLHYTERSLPALLSAAVARRALATGMHALASARIRPMAVLACRDRSGPALWPSLVELACLGLRPAGSSPPALSRCPTPLRDGSVVEVALGDDAGAAWKVLAAEAQSMGAELKPLSQVLRCPVMADSASAPLHPAELFYDAQAVSYDQEQQGHGQSGLRGLEQQLVQRELLQKLGGQERVLELGAGTGRFTALLAAKGCEVVATDASRQMLRILERKAVRDGWKQVRTVHAEMTAPWPEGPFDLVCTFSAVEYTASLAPVFARAAQVLTPGGTLYLTTAHTHPFRLFAQVGNAMRQGIWLHARTVREVRRELARAGFSDVRVATHGLGMMLSAQARKN